MYNINELEFIGESLPKINSNFTELANSVDALGIVSAHYQSVSSSMLTNNPSGATSKIISIDLDGTTQVISKLNSSIYSNIEPTAIYPLIIYVTASFTSTQANAVKFWVKPSSGAIFTQLTYASATSIYPNSYSFTFIDSGFYDWRIDFPPASINTGSLKVVYRYF